MNMEDLKAVVELVGEILQIKLERDTARIERDHAKQSVEALQEEVKYLRRMLGGDFVHETLDEQRKGMTKELCRQGLDQIDRGLNEMANKIGGT